MSTMKKKINVPVLACEQHHVSKNLSPLLMLVRTWLSVLLILCLLRSPRSNNRLHASRYNPVLCAATPCISLNGLNPGVSVVCVVSSSG